MPGLPVQVACRLGRGGDVAGRADLLPGLGGGVVEEGARHGHDPSVNPGADEAMADGAYGRFTVGGGTWAPTSEAGAADGRSWGFRSAGEGWSGLRQVAISRFGDSGLRDSGIWCVAAGRGLFCGAWQLSRM